jgi:nucleotide-binding universal stress UspA family protein
MKTTVVGYDRTPSSEGALAVANRESFWRGASLIVVTAYHGLTFPGQQSPDPADPEATARKAAEQTVQHGADRVREMHPGVPVEARAQAGYAGKVLAEASHGADLLVVGNRGGGGFQGLLPGSDPWPPRRPPANRL